MKKELSLFLFLFSVSLFAQDDLSIENEEVSSEENPLDSISAKKLVPALYFDYGKIFTLRSNFEKKYEVGAEIIVNGKWQLIGEFGFGKLTPQSAFENGDYVARGTYNRFGLGFVPYRDVASRIGIGMRYANSSFRDKGSYLINSPTQLQPDIKESFDRRNLAATWWEVVVYSDLAMNDWLTVGFNLRMRFLRDYGRFDEIEIISIPGYGQAQNKSNPAINLFLKFTPF